MNNPRPTKPIPLAIEHTIKEIETFYQAAAGVQVGDTTLQKVLSMDAQTLNANLIKYTEFPDKLH